MSSQLRTSLEMTVEVHEFFPNWTSRPVLDPKGEPLTFGSYQSALTWINRPENYSPALSPVEIFTRKPSAG